MRQAESVLESIIEQQGLILQQTLFYPASGGQPYDQGIIKIGNYSLKVESVKKFEGGKTLIIPEYIPNDLKIGAIVEQFIDWDLRYKYMKNINFLKTSNAGLTDHRASPRLWQGCPRRIDPAAIPLR